MQAMEGSDLKKILVAAVGIQILFLLLPAGAAPKSAQPKTSAESLLSEAVDFSKNLVDLQRAAVSGDDSGIPTGKLLMVNGMLESLTIRLDTSDNFIAEAELAGGKWNTPENLEDVELYRCFVIFEGPEFGDLFSKNAPAESRIPVSSQILVIGRYMGLAEDYQGGANVAVLNAFWVRRLE
jgi:hypothetical protein